SDGDRPPGPQQPAAAPGSASSSADRATVAAPLPVVARPEGPPRPRECSVLSRITVGLLVLMLGLGLLLDSMGLLDLKPREMLAAMLLVVGTALVAGSFWGRGRPLIPLGILLAAALFLASAAQGVPLRGGAGERLIRPLAMSELRRQYQLGAGELTLDLSSLHVPPGTTRVNASVGMGELTVIAPATSGLMVRAQSGAGRVLVLGHESEGLDSRLDRQEPGSELSGTLDLRLKAGMGEVTVTRQGEPALRPGLPGPVPGFGPPFGAVEEVAP
ncbi:MAG TPA: LiaF domain-containing protein, partial [Actinomycetota bacterium]|nr:LiaF domain-containing protein [Actinomycetota bacterium]